MSDEAKETKAPEGEEAAAKPKKGGGKLPIILALVIVLLGGGFFVMSKRGHKKPKVEAPKLGETVPLKEFLVNLSGDGTYLKTEISLQLSKEGKKEEVEKNDGAIRDAIILSLKTKKLTDLQSSDQIRSLKKEIAADVNVILNREKVEKEKEAAEEKKRQKDADGDSDGSEDAAKKEKPKVPEDYDSDEGPVLKVYFTNFATQGA